MPFEFRPATRSEAKPLIGLYAESGCGKTLSALLLARGFVGPSGRIGMIETESGRGEAYSDPTEYPEIGGYDVLPMRDDFSPASFGKAIAAAEAAKLDALIIDSASHEWEGIGGVLSMAAKNQAAGQKGVIVWQQPKIEHKREFMLRFMQSSVPLVVVCMRAKYPMEQITKPNGGKDWARSEKLEPIQAEDVLFEMFVHGWIDREHKFRQTKCTAKALEAVFADGKPITLETGRQLAAWAAGKPSSAPATQKPATSPDVDAQAALRAAGEAAAERGVEALKAWYGSLDKDNRLAIKGYLDSELKARAAAKDAEHEADAPAHEEEPDFGDTP